MHASECQLQDRNHTAFNSCLTDCLILRVFKASISLLKMIYFLKSESRTWSSTEHAHKEQKFD